MAKNTKLGEGEKIVDIRQTNEYYVTEKHPFAKELGVGKKINISAHTHGPDMLEKGYVSLKEPKNVDAIAKAENHKDKK